MRARLKRKIKNSVKKYCAANQFQPRDLLSISYLTPQPSTLHSDRCFSLGIFCIYYHDIERKWSGVASICCVIFSFRLWWIASNNKYNKMPWKYEIFLFAGPLDVFAVQYAPFNFVVRSSSTLALVNLFMVFYMSGSWFTPPYDKWPQGLCFCMSIKRS